MPLFRRKESWPLPLHLYGKHPVAKDYLRVGCGQGGPRGMREWLDAGFSSGAGPGAVRPLAGPTRFVFGDAWGAALVGTLWPSSDAGGERVFPLAMFVERRVATLAQEFEQGMGRLGGIWRVLDDLYGQLETYGSGGSLLQALRGRAIEEREVEDAGEDALEASTWLEALWPGRGRNGLFDVLDLAAAWKREGYSGPVRVPFVTGAPMCAQAQAWAMLLTRALKDPKKTPPSLVFPAPTAEGALHGVWFQRSPTPADARWLLAGEAFESKTAGEAWDGSERVLGGALSAPEGTPRLVDSLRADAISWLARPPTPRLSSRSREG